MTVTRHIATAITLLLVAAIALGLVVVFLAGIPGTAATGVPACQRPPPPTAERLRMFYIPALFPLIPLGISGFGLLLSFIDPRALWFAWLGLLGTLAVGSLLIFTIGFYLIILAAVLFTPLATTHWESTRHARWLHIAWIGVVLVLVVSVIFLGSPASYLPIAALVIYVPLLAFFEWKFLNSQTT